MIYVDWSEAKERAARGRKRYVAAVTTAALLEARRAGRERAMIDRMFDGIQEQFDPTETVYWTELPDDQGEHYIVLAWKN
jgi:hypothetical protein